MIMLNTPRLTDKQVQTFHDDGFLILRGAFNGDEMAKVSSWSDEMLARPEETGKHWVYHERSLNGDEQDLVGRIENIAAFHDGFKALHEALAVPTGQLLGEDAELFKEKINFKMPGGDGFKPHQDSQAGWDIYADFFISALVSIDAATLENGCLELCAGHHQDGLFRSWEPLSDKDMNGMNFVPCPTEPGDVVFFDCYAPHQSKPNMSDRIRRIYYATYNRKSAGQHLAQYYADKHKNFPPDIDRDPDKNYVYRV
jgi:2-aminoethylphosphonate dioxygenase